MSGFEFLEVARDGEGRSIVGDSFVRKYKLPYKMIEAGSEVVNDLSHDDTPLKRWMARHAYPKDPIAGFLLIIGNDNIRFTFAKGVNLGFEVTDVLFSPFDLRLNGRYLSDSDQMLGLSKHGKEIGKIKPRPKGHALQAARRESRGGIG